MCTGTYMAHPAKPITQIGHVPANPAKDKRLFQEKNASAKTAMTTKPSSSKELNKIAKIGYEPDYLPLQNKAWAGAGDPVGGIETKRVSHQRRQRKSIGRRRRIAVTGVSLRTPPLNDCRA